MINTTEIAFFVGLSRARSLADAARSLDISPSAVSQKLQSLEARLGVRLLDRSGRRLRMTTEGQLLADRGGEILRDIDDVVGELTTRRQKVSGQLRVAAPFGFGRRYVAPVMAELRAGHPELAISLMLYEEMDTTSIGDWDVLVHIGALGGSPLTLHRLAPNRRVLCCSPSFLAAGNMPEKPEDLRDLTFGIIRENRTDESLLCFCRDANGSVIQRVYPSFTSNDGSIVRDWALAGLGVIVRSEWDVAEDLKRGRLVELLPDWRLPDADVVALTAPRSGRVARITGFLDMMRARLKPVPWRSGE